MEAPTHLLYLQGFKECKIQHWGQWHAETFEFSHLMKHQFSSPLKFFYVTDIFIHLFPEATIEIPLYLWRQVCWFKNFVLPLPLRLVSGKLGQGILIYVSKASVVVRSIFIYIPTKKVSSQDDEPQHATVQLLENSKRSCEIWAARASRDNAA